MKHIDARKLKLLQLLKADILISCSSSCTKNFCLSAFFFFLPIISEQLCEVLFADMMPAMTRCSKAVEVLVTELHYYPS